MVKYIIYAIIFILAVDHFYQHYGYKVINTVASYFSNKPVKVFEEEEERKSIVDNIIEKVKEMYEEIRK